MKFLFRKRSFLQQIGTLPVLQEKNPMRTIEKAAIKRKARRLYRKSGYASVCELANGKGLKYGFCIPCDNEMPNIDHECLVCGSMQQNENSPVLPKTKRK